MRPKNNLLDRAITFFADQTKHDCNNLPDDNSDVNLKLHWEEIVKASAAPSGCYVRLAISIDSKSSAARIAAGAKFGFEQWQM